jgi:hypothetical protein
MATEKQLAANRLNAMKSTGPRTAAGRRKSSRNAYRHGLSLPMPVDPQVLVEIEAVAQAVADETASEDQLEVAMAFAEAQLDLKRIRAARTAATPRVLDERLDPKVLKGLCALDRYERLALGRRRLAIRRFDGLDRKESPCK